MKNTLSLYHAISLYLIANVFAIKYEPTWESLDKRPLPKWYDEAKIGILLHWGVYSVPSFGTEWFWYNWKAGNTAEAKFMKDNYPPGFTYQDFAKDFTAEFFNPKDWAYIFLKAGAKYVVLTSKHHEGFTLWPSKYSFSWNAKDVGPNRDLLGDLARTVRDRNLKFGVYYSLAEWFHRLYQADAKTGYKTDDFVQYKIRPEMKELVENYLPDIVWSDGDGGADHTYWKSTEFLAWLYNESPVKDTVVVNDRWGVNITCHHGDFLTCEDKYNPKVLKKHKWENAMSLDKTSFGYQRYNYITNIVTTPELLRTLIETISCGGNILINVGPTHDGRIDNIFQERLFDLGKWLSINGKAIYKTTPWKYQNDTLTDYVWYTSRESSVFAISLQWPVDNLLQLGAPIELFENKKPIVRMLGSTDKLKVYERMWKLLDYQPSLLRVQSGCQVVRRCTDRGICTRSNFILILNRLAILYLAFPIGFVIWSIVNDIKNKTVNIEFPDKSTVACNWAWTIQIDTFILKK